MMGGGKGWTIGSAANRELKEMIVSCSSRSPFPLVRKYKPFSEEQHQLTASDSMKGDGYSPQRRIIARLTEGKESQSGSQQ